MKKHAKTTHGAEARESQTLRELYEAVWMQFEDRLQYPSPRDILAALLRTFDYEGGVYGRQSAAEVLLDSYEFLCEIRPDLWRDEEVRERVHRLVSACGLPARASVQEAAVKVPPPAPETETGNEPENVFQKSGDIWKIRFKGEETFHVQNSIGMQYLAILLQKPGVWVDCSELIKRHAVTRRPLVYTEFEDLGPERGFELIDKAAREGVIKKLKSLARERAEIEGKDEPDSMIKLGEIDAETEKLGNYLRKGRWGRPPLSPSLERDRKSVSNALMRAVKKIEGYDNNLGEHLEKIKTGNSVAYLHGTDVFWSVSM